jgi:hypothetical protein
MAIKSMDAIRRGSFAHYRKRLRLACERRRRRYRDEVMLAVRTMAFGTPFTSIVTVTDFGFAFSAPWD